MGNSALPFDPDALDAPLAALDELPRGLWLGSLTNSLGRPAQRLDALLTLRGELIAGRLPAQCEWPVGSVLPLLLAQLVELDLPALCEHHEDIADQVLRSMLWHTDRIVDYCAFMDETAAALKVAQGFRDEWEPMSHEIRDMLFVFGDIGDLVKFNRWDLTRGRLRSGAWQELMRIRKLLEEIPELREMVQKLGRARQTDIPDLASAPEVQVMEPVTATVTEWCEIQVPELPAQTRGIERSGRASRMLPSEAVLLPHPRLRLIWFARHAERTLLTYEDNDTLREPVSVQRETWRPATRPRPERKLEMGPMILCVDTSGSMQGGAESVAKALVLEATRIARAQQRACYVYAFSGPDEVIERELSLDVPGVDSLLGFMTQSFNGGTDICEPLERALSRLEDAAWQFADLLIASDGEFGAPPAIAARVRAARDALGVRVQGVLIGDRETIGLRELADDIFWVRDWRHYGRSGAAAGECPVHDKSLTAMYFPNALR
jgi:uncharacterized protein with von Willebrand factor type A (vWA) domain